HGHARPAAHQPRTRHHHRRQPALPRPRSKLLGPHHRDAGGQDRLRRQRRRGRRRRIHLHLRPVTHCRRHAALRRGCNGVTSVGVAARPTKPRPSKPRPNWAIRALVVLALVVTVVAAVDIDFDLTPLLLDGGRGWFIVSEFLKPDWAFLLRTI